MCGICGIFSPEGIAQDERELIVRMCRTLVHRGPDDGGTYTDSKVAIGMRRLSIIDLHNGHQPMSNENDTIWIVFNGEIYNFRELRRKLEKKGHVFKTNTDTETIIHAYEEYNENCVCHLNGMFAFALWDTRTKRIFAARDRLGQKPFYYTFQKTRFVFGSELKAVLCDRRVSRKIDYSALHHYLTLQYIPDPLSIFQDIKKLPPAHIMTYDGRKTVIKRYWDISYVPKCKMEEGEATKETRRLLEKSVKRRLISDVPLGAFLSGGVDSSLVVGLMAQNSKKKIKTFSIGFDYESFNELPYARVIAEKWDTEHHEFIVTPDDMSDLLPKLVCAFDEPFGDSCAFQTYYLAQKTREHVTVALNGDGGDELFAGYPRYWLDRMVRPYTALPAIITQRIVPRLIAGLTEPSDVVIEENWRIGLKRLAQVTRISKKASIMRWGSFFNEEMKKELYTNSFKNELGYLNTADLLSQDFDRADAESFLDKTLFVDTMNYLPGNNLVKMDRMTMVHSLEGRSPFLDHELVEFAARLPERFKIRYRDTKYILRRGFRDYLPGELSARGKRGFGAPIEMWLRKDLRNMVHDLLLSANTHIAEFCEPRLLQELIVDHETGKHNYGKKIWTLLVLECWCKQQENQ